ncbi:HGxxPAAW family protein [Planomonospora sp. ID82291]|uniref:HGxxPAAW family protein n=1 Tax=Planomonospora sp. ID82291 TaxID=2738136 RepID=UPI001E5349FC|nr:HGxxPAAW family protein [Planomonospora sp. ID82291]
MTETASGPAPETGHGGGHGDDGIPGDRGDRGGGGREGSGDGGHGGHGGRASSWLAVTVSVLGFAIGGVGLTAGPDWFVFWLGAAVFALGGILLLAFGAFGDVVVDAPRTRAGHREGVLG